MNPPGTIGGNCPNYTGPVSFGISNSLRGMSYFFNRSALWYDAAISENTGSGKLFKNDGCEKCFDVEKDGHIKSNCVHTNHANLRN